MFENAYNYLSEKNNVTISFCSSQSKGCNSKNILSNNQKNIWLSEKNVPQTIIFNLTRMIKLPTNYFKYFGIYCWHSYTTNPKIIQISFSENNNKYYNIGEFELNMLPSPQFFQIDNIINKRNIKKIKYLKLIIKETFGGNRTYINQVFLFDDTIEIKSNYFLNDNEEHLEESENEEDEKKYIKNYNLSDKENIKKNIKKNSNLLNEEIKEKKLKKIEKILKEKILNNISEKETLNEKEDEINKYITPENENEEEEEEDNYPNVNLNDYLSNENSKRQTSNKLYYSSNIMSGNQTESEDPFKTNNYISNSNSAYSTNYNKRNLTPIPKSSKKLFKSPENENNYINHKSKNDNKVIYISSNNENNEYKRLENQLKEMEIRLKVLEPNYDINKNLSHSKSFSFLPKDSNKILSQSNNQFINPNNSNFINENNSQFTPSLRKEELISSKNSNNENINSINSNKIIINEDRIKILENKMNKFENELSEMKTQINKLSDYIQTLITMKESNENNQINNNKQLIKIILKECEKLINIKLSEFNYQLNNNQYSQATNKITHEYYPNNNINYNNISIDTDLNSLEFRLNKKIDERLNVLANNIQSQINDNLLIPSIKSIEKTMKNNMEEIKDKLIQLNLTSNNNNNLNQSNSFIDSYRVSKSLLSSQNDNKSSSVKRNEKYEEINKIGEKLYDKLVEKEKKLQEFKNETTNYFKRKLKNDERKFTNSINSLNSQSNNMN